MDEITQATLAQIAVSRDRIATALEAIPHPAPNIVRDLSDYPGFDWDAINAKVIARDKHGAVAVRYNGRIYTRRNPRNKYGIAIWYSRAHGKDGDDTLYERLITFKEVKVEADPLHEKTIEALRQVQQSRAS